MEYNDIETQQNRSFRRLLRVFCVLSIIGSGLYALSYLMWSLILPMVQTQYDAGQIPVPEEFTVTIESFLDTPRAFYLCASLLYALSVVGVVMMWNIRRLGFHLYTLAQLLILLVTALFLGRSHVMLGDIMLTLLFITVYFICMRRLGDTPPPAAEEQADEE